MLHSRRVGEVSEEGCQHIKLSLQEALLRKHPHFVHRCQHRVQILKQVNRFFTGEVLLGYVNSMHIRGVTFINRSRLSKFSYLYQTICNGFETIISLKQIFLTQLRLINFYLRFEKVVRREQRDTMNGWSN